MTTQFITRSIAVLAFGLLAPALVAPAAAHAEPTVQFITPKQRATVPAGTQYEIKVKVTGPEASGGTLWLQFPMNPDKAKVSRQIVLDAGQTETEETFAAGPNEAGTTYRACASVHFAAQKSKVVCIEWYVK